MVEVFGIISSLISGFINFLDSFIVFNGLSLLKIFIIIILFYFSIYFLINKKE